MAVSIFLTRDSPLANEHVSHEPLSKVVRWFSSASASFWFNLRQFGSSLSVQRNHWQNRERFGRNSPRRGERARPVYWRRPVGSCGGKSQRRLCESPESA